MVSGIIGLFLFYFHLILFFIGFTSLATTVVRLIFSLSIWLSVNLMYARSPRWEIKKVRMLVILKEATFFFIKRRYGNKEEVSNDIG